MANWTTISPPERLGRSIVKRSQVVLCLIVFQMRAPFTIMRKAHWLSPSISAPSRMPTAKRMRRLSTEAGTASVYSTIAVPRTGGCSQSESCCTMPQAAAATLTSIRSDERVEATRAAGNASRKSNCQMSARCEGAAASSSSRLFHSSSCHLRKLIYCESCVSDWSLRSERRRTRPSTLSLRVSYARPADLDMGGLGCGPSGAAALRRAAGRMKTTCYAATSARASLPLPIRCSQRSAAIGLLRSTSAT